MTIDKLTALRLQLLANGYVVLPSKGKVPGYGWQRAKITPDFVKSWKGARSRGIPTTGMRIENPIRAIDADIYDPELAAGFLEDVKAIAPAVFEAGLLRIGQPPKFTLFARGLPSDALFYRWHSSDWTRDDVTAHAVEIFGGSLSPRYFGLYGPHSFDDEGKVALTYEWPRASLVDVPAADLPVIDTEGVLALLRAFDARAEAMGFRRVVDTKLGQSVPTWAYDLTDETRFDVDGGGSGLTLAELETEYHVAKHEGRDCRVSASFLGRGEHNTTRCQVGWSERLKALTVHVHGDEITHVSAALLPFGQRTVLAEAIRRALENPFGSAAAAAELPPDNWSPPPLLPPLPEPAPRGADEAIKAEACALAARWLLDHYALFVRGERGGSGKAVAIRTREWTPTALSALRSFFIRYGFTLTGPRGGQRKVNPVDVWLSDPDLVTVDGYRTAPDQPWPLFDEAGHRFVNLYKRPELPETGDPSGGHRLIEALLPDDTERAYYRQWLAHKLLHPEVPQVGVVMIAQGAQGTGRGFLSRLIAAALGETYCGSRGFPELVSSGGQGQYTGFMADSLMMFINETSTEDDNRFQRQRESYERLKELVDPARRLRSIVRKYQPEEMVLCGPSFHFFTNRGLPLTIDPGDRRLAILRNGPIPSDAFFDEIAAWLDRPSNIGAFRREIEMTDLTGYRPFQAPMTAGKEDVEDRGLTEIDHAVEDALGLLPGALYAVPQVVEAISIRRSAVGWHLRSEWELLATRVAKNQGFRIGRRNGPNWKPRLDGKRFNTGAYARTGELRDAWSKADAAAVAAQLQMNEDALAALRQRPGKRPIVGVPKTKKAGPIDENPPPKPEKGK